MSDDKKVYCENCKYYIMHSKKRAGKDACCYENNIEEYMTKGSYNTEPRESYRYKNFPKDINSNNNCSWYKGSYTDEIIISIFVLFVVAGVFGGLYSIGEFLSMK